MANQTGQEGDGLAQQAPRTSVNTEERRGARGRVPTRVGMEGDREGWVRESRGCFSLLENKKIETKISPP